MLGGGAHASRQVGITILSNDQQQLQDQSSSSHPGRRDVLALLPRPLRVPATVAFYMTASLTLILINKSVLNLDIKLPISLLWLQTAVCVALIWVLGYMDYVDVPQLTIQKCRQLTPLVVGNVIVLCLNTFTLRYVDASVFQIARGATLPCTIFFQYLINGHGTGKLSILAAVVIVMGFMTGLLESHEHEEAQARRNMGFMLGFLSSVGSAINACYSARGVSIVDGNTVHLVYYNQTMLVLVLFPLWLVSGEHDGLMASLDGPQGMTLVSSICMTGVFAFLINLAGFLQIKMTSPASHIVSGAVRGVLQTLLAGLFLGETISALRMGGTFIIIVGSSLYTYSKSLSI